VDRNRGIAIAEIRITVPESGVGGVFLKFLGFSNPNIYISESGNPFSVVVAD
jgi:hypothetical protein